MKTKESREVEMIPMMKEFIQEVKLQLSSAQASANPQILSYLNNRAEHILYLLENGGANKCPQCGSKSIGVDNICVDCRFDMANEQAFYAKEPNE
jgi:hypothetical protein